MGFEFDNMFVLSHFQVLAKASKIIPVMIMGKVVSRETYESYEYVTAGFISVGMAFFLFGSSDNDRGNFLNLLLPKKRVP